MQCTNGACKSCCLARGGCQSQSHRLPGSSQSIAPSAVATVVQRADVAQLHTTYFDTTQLSSSATSLSDMLSPHLSPQSLPSIPPPSSSSSGALRPSQPPSITPSLRAQSPIFFSDVTGKENIPLAKPSVKPHLNALQQGYVAARAAASYVTAYGWTTELEESVVKQSGAYINGTVTIDAALVKRLGLVDTSIELFIHRTRSWSSIEVPYHIKSLRLPMLEGVPLVLLRAKGTIEPPRVQELLALGPEADPVNAPGPVNDRRVQFRHELKTKVNSSKPKPSSSVSQSKCTSISQLKHTSVSQSKRPASSSPPNTVPKKHRYVSPSSPPFRSPSFRSPSLSSIIIISSSPSPSAPPSSPALSVRSRSPSVQVKSEPADDDFGGGQHDPSKGSELMINGDIVEIIEPENPGIWPGSYYVIDIAWVFTASRLTEYQGNGELESLFRLAFPGFPEERRIPRANFYALRKHWEEASEELKQDCLNASRKPEGRWKKRFPEIKGGQLKKKAKPQTKPKPKRRIVKRRIVDSSDSEVDSEADDVDELDG